jgi:hypothetical protein
VSTTTATEEVDSTVPITTEEDATESTATETIEEPTNPETEVVAPGVQTEAVTEPPAETPVEAEVVSWLNWLLPVALAEEVVPESTPIDISVPLQNEDEAIVDDVATLDTLPIEVVEATTSLASSTATNTEPVYVTPTTAGIAATPQFAVFFKVKDDPWIRLGEIITIHNDIRLPLPKAIVAEISSFADVSVRLEALPQFDDVPPVYLDALWIEVDYAPLDALGVHAISPLVPTTYTIADIILPVSTTSSSSLSTISTEQATSSVLLPRSVADFATSLRWIQGVDGRFVLAEIVEGTSTELWLFDMPALTITRIGFSEGGLGSIRPIVKDGLIFWQNTTGNKIFTYDTRIAGQLYEYLLVSNLPEADEYLFTFPYTSWNVVWRGSQFFMFHPDTGEVFGDSDGRSLDAFNRLFTLTSLLSTDELDALSITPLLSTNSDGAVAE